MGVGSVLANHHGDLALAGGDDGGEPPLVKLLGKAVPERQQEIKPVREKFNQV